MPHDQTSDLSDASNFDSSEETAEKVSTMYIGICSYQLHS